MNEPVQICSNSKGRKPGPKPSRVRSGARAMFPEWSERTFATYWTAVRQLVQLDELEGNEDGQSIREVAELASRPNGTMSVTQFADMADMRLALWIIQNRPEDGS